MHAFFLHFMQLIDLGVIVLVIFYLTQFIEKIFGCFPCFLIVEMYPSILKRIYEKIVCETFTLLEYYFRFIEIETVISDAETERMGYLMKILKLTIPKLNDKNILDSSLMSYTIHYKIYKEAMEQLFGKEVVERRIKDMEEKEKREKEEKKHKEKTPAEELEISEALNRAEYYKQLLNQIISGQKDKKDANLLITNLSNRDKQKKKRRHLEFTPTVPKRAL